MNNAKQDILALILVLVGFGGAVMMVNQFSGQEEGGTPPAEQSTRHISLKQRGMQVVRNCIQCHDLTHERKITRIGPPLWGVFGQPAGSQPGFQYSLAYQSITGLSWNEDTLDTYLKNPQAVIPGTTSTFTGIQNEVERRAVIDYLKALRMGRVVGIKPLINQSPLVQVSDVTSELQAGQIKRGRTVAQHCKACHDLTSERKNIIGPYLWNIIGRAAGAVESFHYSTPLMAKANQNLHWTPETLESFLKSPSTYIPGTRMLFNGIKNEQNRTDLIAFLHTLQ